METPKPIREFTDTVMCFVEYAGLWALEKYRAIGEAIDDAMEIDFGDLED